MDPEVRDAASSLLAGARRESQDLAVELQERLGRYLRNPDVSAHLSDAYKKINPIGKISNAASRTLICIHVARFCVNFC